MSEGEWVKCPCCGWQWKKEHTARHAIREGDVKAAKGEFSFDKGNLESDAFISFREIPGGRANPDNFREIERLTLREAKNKPEYQNQINSLKEKVRKIAEILKD